MIWDFMDHPLSNPHCPRLTGIGGQWNPKNHWISCVFNTWPECLRMKNLRLSDFILEDRPVLIIQKFYYLSSPLPNLRSNLWPPINLSLNRRKIKNIFSFYIISHSAIIRLISRVEGEILNLKIPKISPLNISSLADVRQSGINHSLKTDFRKNYIRFGIWTF